MDMPQVYLPFATEARGQTLYEHVQANQAVFVRAGTIGA